MTGSVTAGPGLAVPTRVPPGPLDRLGFALAALALLCVGLGATAEQGGIGVLLALVGAGLGAILWGAEFGYTGAFRRLVLSGQDQGFAAGALVAGVAAPVVILLGAYGGEAYGALVAPLGLPVAGGAVLFGIGMQLANGCGSGCLYAAGGGSKRLLVALPFFMAGGVVGSLLLPSAMALPSLGTVWLPGELGPIGGLVATEAVVAALVLFAGRGRLPEGLALRAAIGLGVLAAAVFALTGFPWGVTWALTLWGAKAADVAGFDLSGFAFWSQEWTQAALASPFLAEPVTVLNLALLAGAALVSAWSGKLRGQPWPPLRGLVAAALGGLLMGIGARLSFGCNIGAYIGGLSSGSLAALLWMAGALLGSRLALPARRWAGLT